MISVPDDVRERLRLLGQEHVLTWWDRLTDDERRGLLEQLKTVDLEQLRQLYTQRERTYALPAFDRIAPIAIQSLEKAGPNERRLGEDSLRRGETAVLVVAGGQGSRLGFEHPKGMFPIGPVSNNSLFQIHAEKVLALRRRFGGSIPFLVMTSPSNREETEAFFRERRYFGLPAEEVFFFQQGTMPALDLATGKLLLELPGSLFLSPNGHGGTLLALADSGLLDRLRQRGVRQVFYFQVDNPLVKIADPAFLGHHLQARAEVSTKVVSKNSPEDRLGNLVLVDGRCAMIEYSDLPKELGRQTDEAGRLRYRAGNTAIHIFDLVFLDRVTRSADRIPFHVAKKKVPYLDATGQVVEPTTENALKFEMFIFDVLPKAQRWTVVETSRAEEFEPLKNATGAESPESVRRAMTNLAAGWLTKAAVSVPRKQNGEPAFPLEISPLFALDAEELAVKVDRKLHIQGPVFLDDKVTMLHATIMAGGGGTRFWPRSRQKRPKQFLALTGDRTLLQLALDRIEAAVPPEQTWIITSANYREEVARQLPSLPADHIVGEPCGRDTAACIALGAAMVARQDPHAIMLVMPADHVIEPVQEFRRAVHVAAQMAEEHPNALVTFGIPPTYPAVGYGYIQRGPEIANRQGIGIYRVQQFHEKPLFDLAQKYVTAGGYFWNSGIFVWKAATILQALEKNQPTIYTAVGRIAESWPTSERDTVFQREYSSLGRISIDHAVMEKHPERLMVQAPFKWDDVGSWLALERSHPQDGDGNTVLALHCGLKTKGCVIVADDGHLVATAGVNNLLIVQDGDATLVADRNDEAAVKDLVELLKKKGLEKYL